MVVIRLSKKKKNFFFINSIYKKNSVYGKILKRIGFYDSLINYSKNYFVNYKILFFYIKNGAKLSKRVYYFLKK
ncbi:ribosomal protein S16 [Candidatus Carsonella ruddii HT isolate Thao2000]|uniref:Ribosomal protein S16 n=1 Tax=Candidatus Carsonella ruddii HT isolate Thao2000 TaxID=1202539 RepID=J3VQD4_CARRU|nr:hypothetical protein [Candidatus Carsonella ruddii]AFP84171.1 ribosomal protein S16 [Candidatus Carsonella ruddii HT isolate Thao2000]